MASASPSKARYYGAGPIASSSTGLAPPSASRQVNYATPIQPYGPDGSRQGGNNTYPYPAYDYNTQQQAGGSNNGGGRLNGGTAAQYNTTQYAAAAAAMSSPGGGGGGGGVNTGGQLKTGRNAGAPSTQQQEFQYQYNTYLPVPDYMRQSHEPQGNIKQERGGAWGGDAQQTYQPQQQETYYDPSMQQQQQQQQQQGMGGQYYHPPSSLLPPQATTPPHQIQSSLPGPSHSETTPNLSPSKAGRKAKKIEKDEEIPRPRNSWILYRSEMLRRHNAGQKLEQIDALGDGKGGKGIPQSHISKVVSELWKAEPPEEKAKWEKKALEEKKAHELMYPNYKFQPKRKEEKAAQRAAKQAERARDKELKNAAAGGNRRRRARSPAADGDHHPYAHGMGRTSSYMGSSHPPEHRVGGLYQTSSRLANPMETQSDNEYDRVVPYPFPMTMPNYDMYPIGQTTQQTPSESPNKGSTNAQQAQQTTEWFAPPPDSTPITNHPPFSPFRTAENTDQKSQAVPYIFKPIAAQPIMLPAEYAPQSDYLLDEDLLAEAWVDMAQVTDSAGNDLGFGSFNFENMANPDAWTAHENENAPILTNVFSPAVRDLISADWDLAQNNAGMTPSYGAMPSSALGFSQEGEGDQTSTEGPALPVAAASPVALPSGWMSPTSALAPGRGFSETYPGLESQLMDWPETYDENEAPLDKLDPAKNDGEAANRNTSGTSAVGSNLNPALGSAAA